MRIVEILLCLVIVGVEKSDDRFIYLLELVVLFKFILLV